MGGKERFLAFNANLIEQDMAGIAKQLFVVHVKKKAGRIDGSGWLMTANSYERMKQALFES